MSFMETGFLNIGCLCKNRFSLEGKMTFVSFSFEITSPKQKDIVSFAFESNNCDE